MEWKVSDSHIMLQCVNTMAVCSISIHSNEAALHLIKHKKPKPWSSVGQDCVREVNFRSFGYTYISSDFMCWQTLSACSTLSSSSLLLPEITSITLARHQKQISKQGESKQAKNYCCMTKSVALS